MGRKRQVNWDEVIELKSRGWSGERVSRALKGAITGNQANAIYRDSKRINPVFAKSVLYGTGGALTNNNGLGIVTICAEKKSCLSLIPYCASTKGQTAELSPCTNH